MPDPYISKNDNLEEAQYNPEGGAGIEAPNFKANPEIVPPSAPEVHAEAPSQPPSQSSNTEEDLAAVRQSLHAQQEQPQTRLPKRVLGKTKYFASEYVKSLDPRGEDEKLKPFRIRNIPLYLAKGFARDAKRIFIDDPKRAFNFSKKLITRKPKAPPQPPPPIATQAGPTN